MGNAGASFAKSKTAIEAEGLFNGIGSDAHLASTSMARAGGAFKDVTAPILCSQIKSMSIWALFMAPTIFISPYMPFVIECAVTRTTYESIFTCMDWNKVYWSILPGVLLIAVNLLVYWFFWSRDSPDSRPNTPSRGGNPAIEMVESSRSPRRTPPDQEIRPAHHGLALNVITTQGVQHHTPPPEPTMSAPTRPNVPELDNQ